MAQIVPYPADVYYLALEEYLLLNALRLCALEQGGGLIRPALGLAPRNDIIREAHDLLGPEPLRRFLTYAGSLGATLKRCLDTHMPEPPGSLQPQAPVVAEVMAWHYLKDGDAPVWSAVRQAIAELSWEPGRHGFSPGDHCNLTLGAYRKGS